MSEPHEVVMLKDFKSETLHLDLKAGEKFTCSGGLARLLRDGKLAEIRNLLDNYDDDDDFMHGFSD